MVRKRKILIVDDQAELRRMLCMYFETENFQVMESECGAKALELAEKIPPDLVLLDLGLSDMDGKTVISSLRKKSHVPIVVLTARRSDQEAAWALNLGADDYVTKPFNAEILLARINAILRVRVRAPDKTDLYNGPIRIDTTRHEVYVREKYIHFSPKEFDLMHLFVSRMGQMLTHREILRHVWGPAHAADIQYLRVYLRQIRTKLGMMPELDNLVVSEAGVGYRMEVLIWDETPAYTDAGAAGAHFGRSNGLNTPML